jgi:hypothetical protein
MNYELTFQIMFCSECSLLYITPSVNPDLQRTVRRQMALDPAGPKAGHNNGHRTQLRTVRRVVYNTTRYLSSQHVEVWRRSQMGNSYKHNEIHGFCSSWS